MPPDRIITLNERPAPKLNVRRVATGVIAAALLAGAAWISFFPVEVTNNDMLMGALVRVGLLMAAICLAYNEMSRLPAWIWAVLPALFAVLAVRPRWFFIALPIVLALAILKPRRKPK